MGLNRKATPTLSGAVRARNNAGAGRRGEKPRDSSTRRSTRDAPAQRTGGTARAFGKHSCGVPGAGGSSGDRAARPRQPGSRAPEAGGGSPSPSPGAAPLPARGSPRPQPPARSAGRLLPRRAPHTERRPRRRLRPRRRPAPPPTSSCRRRSRSRRRRRRSSSRTMSSLSPSTWHSSGLRSAGGFLQMRDTCPAQGGHGGRAGRAGPYRAVPGRAVPGRAVPGRTCLRRSRCSSCCRISARAAAFRSERLRLPPAAIAPEAPRFRCREPRGSAASAGRRERRSAISGGTAPRAAAPPRGPRKRQAAV